MGYPVDRPHRRLVISPSKPSEVLPPLPRRRDRSKRRFDIGLVVALAWLMCAAVGTVVWGADLGLRGIAWLVLHHILCVVGCAHEIRRAWYRRKRS